MVNAIQKQLNFWYILTCHSYFQICIEISLGLIFLPILIRFIVIIKYHFKNRFNLIYFINIYPYKHSLNTDKLGESLIIF